MKEAEESNLKAALMRQARDIQRMVAGEKTMAEKAVAAAAKLAEKAAEKAEEEKAKEKRKKDELAKLAEAMVRSDYSGRS